MKNNLRSPLWKIKLRVYNGRLQASLSRPLNPQAVVRCPIEPRPQVANLEEEDVQIEGFLCVITRLPSRNRAGGSQSAGL